MTGIYLTTAREKNYQISKLVRSKSGLVFDKLLVSIILGRVSAFGPCKGRFKGANPLFLLQTKRNKIVQTSNNLFSDW